MAVVSTRTIAVVHTTVRIIRLSALISVVWLLHHLLRIDTLLRLLTVWVAIHLSLLLRIAALLWVTTLLRLLTVHLTLLRIAALLWVAALLRLLTVHLTLLRIAALLWVTALLRLLTVHLSLLWVAALLRLLTIHLTLLRITSLLSHCSRIRETAHAALLSLVRIREEEAWFRTLWIEEFRNVILL